MPPRQTRTTRSSTTTANLIYLSAAIIFPTFGNLLARLQHFFVPLLPHIKALNPAQGISLREVLLTKQGLNLFARKKLARFLGN